MKKFVASLFKKKGSEFGTNKPDQERSFNDLLFDVIQKRKLIKMLVKANQKLKYLHLVSSIALVFVIIFVIITKKDPEVETFKQYYLDYKYRYIQSYGLGTINIDDFQDGLSLADELMISLESKMLVALQAIDKKEFGKAISILNEIDTPESEWLKALCLMRVGKDYQAEILLLKIVEKNNLFSAEAKDIFYKHYRNNTPE